jgi:hypothetical protein
MRLSVSMLLALAAVGLIGGCGAEPPCVDEDGEELNVCEVKVAGSDPILYCPGDHWGSEDGCISYGCGADGEVLETPDVCAQ